MLVQILYCILQIIYVLHLHWMMWNSLRSTFQQILSHRPQHFIWDQDHRLFGVPWRFHTSMASLLVDNNGNTTMSLDCQTLQATRLWHIHSSLSRCTQVPWHPFTLLVSCLALVNEFHHWSVIQWFLPMLDFDTFIRMVRIVPWILASMKTNGFMESTTTCSSTFY